VINSDPPLLQNVEDPFLDPWADYLGGAWIRTLPERPGVYSIATLEGHVVGYRELRMRDGELVDTLHVVNEPGWQGFWWSQPLPPPPKEVPEVEA
jgi:hypothetical protein